MNTLHRRQFIKNGLTMLSTISFVPLPNGLFRTVLSSDTIYRFNVGQAKCSVLHDYTHTYATEEFFSDISPDIEARFDAYSNIQDGKVASHYDAMLIQLNGQNILIDTGIGSYKDPVTIGEHAVKIDGKLLTLLKEEKLEPEDIDIVLLSHFHPDHIGGIYSEQGKLNFPNASFVAGKNEWDFWHSSKAESLPPLFTDFVKANIAPLENSDVQLLESDSASVLPGLTAFHAEGHTPGHLVFMLESENEKLIYAADTFLHPIHIEDLNVQTVYDYDHKLAKKSREKVLVLAKENDALLHVFHFTHPGLGHISQKGKGWHWESISDT